MRPQEDSGSDRREVGEEHDREGDDRTPDQRFGSAGEIHGCTGQGENRESRARQERKRVGLGEQPFGFSPQGSISVTEARHHDAHQHSAQHGKGSPRRDLHCSDLEQVREGACPGQHLQRRCTRPARSGRGVDPRHGLRRRTEHDRRPQEDRQRGGGTARRSRRRLGRWEKNARPGSSARLNTPVQCSRERLAASTANRIVQRPPHSIHTGPRIQTTAFTRASSA